MTKIEWADKTWNPITGCTKISSGCTNCYAEGMAKRFWGTRKFSDIEMHPDRLNDPLKWKKPSKIFVCSMGDLFHENVSFYQIDSVFNTIIECQLLKDHIFMLLTKRPRRMKAYLEDSGHWTLDNIMCGVTVENQAEVRRIGILNEIPVNRFISVEPMLSRLKIAHYLPKVDWVIVGCESGSKRRHTDIEWMEDLKDACIIYNVPVFIKQAEINGKIVKMPKIDGKVWDQTP